MYTKSIHHFFLLSQILLDVYLMYTKNVHHGNVIHTVYTICLQKVYYQCSNFGKGFCSVRRRKVRKICLTFFRTTCVFHSVEFDFSLPLNLAATVSLKLLFIHSKTSKTLISSAFVHVPRLLTAVAIFFRPFSPQRTLSSSSLV